ncbi:MAG: hypothetical protein FJZ63_02235 [Chlamydiae bacterium]|nr:hypothetical protein [Chlamydiota bacterium]
MSFANLLKKGTLLVATPEISSGLFAKSVILLCEYGATGAFGLIINKPLEAELPEELVEGKLLSNSHVQLRASGPIQSNQLMILHNDKEYKQSLNVCDGVFLGGDLEFLQTALTLADGPSLLLCFGYAGWGPGLLEEDLMNGAWITGQGSHHYTFECPPEKLWQKVLRDKGGKYTTLSLIPEDLDLN